MKKFLNILLIASFSMAGCYTSGQVAQSDNYNYPGNYDNGDLSYQTFYDQLQPYGNWVNYPGYGNVWQPYANRNFRPYETSGHWVSTIDGWAWESDYNWGWAPFHYGRWFFDPSIGWAWVPGYEWAPAWVTWGQYDNYYAWAPLAPGINIGIGNNWRAPSNYWSFVPRNCINYSNLNRYVVPNYNANVNNITIINNYNSYNQKDYYHRGPDYQEVQRFTHKEITPVAIASTNRPGSSKVSDRQFQIYRPTISRNNSNAQGQITSPTTTRPYNGTVRGNPGEETRINRPDGRVTRNPNLNDVREQGDASGVSKGINGGDNNVSQQNIDNSNRRLQQQQMERLYKTRTQATNDNSSIYNSPSDIRSAPQSAPQVKQPQVNRNYNPVENSQPRPQPRLEDQRIMQRLPAPVQNERMMRAPEVQPAMPSRMENRATNPARSMQVERPANMRRQ